jgi:outer membrane lipoprotein-sorting protein
MYKIITLLTFIFISLNSQAQGDAKAKVILDKVSAKVKSLKALKANFSITITGAKGGKPQTKNGNVSMKGTKYYVSISGQEIYCDNKTSWTYMKESNEVQVSAYDPSENSFSPSKLFTNFYDKEFSYKYIGTSTVTGKKVEVIHLVPTTKTNKYNKVELYIDVANNIVAGGKLYEKNGNIYSYSVSGFTANPNLTDAMFVFDTKKYPKVEVVDLR